MKESAVKVELGRIHSLRALFLQESNFQVRYNACHERGWTDSYLLTIEGTEVGYGSIKGQEIPNRDTVFEFFVVPPFRKFCSVLFRELLLCSKAAFVECQSNDLLLTAMLYEFARNVNADTILFEDHAVTHYALPGAEFRRRHDGDGIFEHTAEPVGDYVVTVSGEVVATGGLMLHYNKPFADLYMEVRPDCRNKGYGSFLLQEVKKESYLAGRVPAARTSIRNTASRATLIKAGLRVCGFMLLGKVETASG